MLLKEKSLEQILFFLCAVCGRPTASLHLRLHSHKCVISPVLNVCAVGVSIDVMVFHPSVHIWHCIRIKYGGLAHGWLIIGSLTECSSHWFWILHIYMAAYSAQVYATHILYISIDFYGAYGLKHFVNVA
ncbi:hypothetical protein GDO81_010561 [Engystomops pustulosus]|uniref:Uncharacterized protein n=1 Tax=Engystomops pustulosus TaxID=76066 RepID=A0AAV7C1X2_ENGPU|nr:hypothetical protein GDO81_010561 [Engystomops pustulosus]